MPSWNANVKVYRKYLEQIVKMYRSREDLSAYLELILTITAAIVFILFAIRPTFITIAKLYKEKGEKENIIKVLEQKRQNLQTAQENFNKYQQEINLLNNEVMPGKPKPDEIIIQIEGLSIQNNILILNHKIDEVPLVAQTTETSSEGQMQNFEINLMITGEYDQIYEFLKDLENFRRPFSFNLVSLQLSSDEDRGFLGGIMANLGLVAHYYE